MACCRMQEEPAAALHRVAPALYSAVPTLYSMAPVLDNVAPALYSADGPAAWEVQQPPCSEVPAAGPPLAPCSALQHTEAAEAGFI